MSNNCLSLEFETKEIGVLDSGIVEDDIIVSVLSLRPKVSQTQEL